MAAGMARLSPFRQYDSHVYPPDAGAAAYIRRSILHYRLCRYHDFRADAALPPSTAEKRPLSPWRRAYLLLLVPGFPLINSVADMF